MNIKDIEINSFIACFSTSGYYIGLVKKIKNLLNTSMYSIKGRFFSITYDKIVNEFITRLENPIIEMTKEDIKLRIRETISSEDYIAYPYIDKDNLIKNNIDFPKRVEEDDSINSLQDYYWNRLMNKLDISSNKIANTISSFNMLNKDKLPNPLVRSVYAVNNNNQLTLAIDIDGTIFEHNEYEKNQWGQPIKDAIETINELHDKYNCYIILYTAREDDEKEALRKYLAQHKLHYDELIMNKPKADFYIDDKAIQFKQANKEEDINIGDIYILSNLMLYKVVDIRYNENNENPVFITKDKDGHIIDFLKKTLDKIPKFYKENIKLDIQNLDTGIRATTYYYNYKADKEIPIISDIISKEDSTQSIMDNVYRFILDINNTTEEELYG